jgi:hypothetical protein
MRRAHWILPALAAVVACGGSQPPPPDPPAAEVARLDGLDLWDGPFAEGDRDVAQTWERVQALLADRPEPPPGGPDGAWIRETWTTWLRAHVVRLEEVGAELAIIAEHGGPREQVFAAASYGALLESLVVAVSTLPTPRELEASPQAAAFYRSELAHTFAPLAADARDAYLACADGAPEAPVPMQAWGARCEQHARGLDAIAAAAQPPPVIIPSECEGPPFTDPDAPAPDASRPMEIALVESGERFTGAQREQLIAAVQRRLATDRSLRLVPRAEVRRAEQLVAERRWRAGGPVCGQAPPLPALLAERHANLAIGTITRLCTPQPEVRCTLHVTFDRAGTDDQDGAPRPWRAQVEGDPEALATWTRAAGRLEASDTAIGHGSGFGSGGRFFAVAGVDDDDAFLRVGPTLEAARGAIAACYAGAGIASFGATFTVSEAGAVSDVVATPITAPSSDIARAQACVGEAIRALSFPCPRGGAAVRVEARVCTGEQPAAERE